MSNFKGVELENQNLRLTITQSNPPVFEELSEQDMEAISGAGAGTMQEILSSPAMLEYYAGLRKQFEAEG